MCLWCVCVCVCVRARIHTHACIFMLKCVHWISWRQNYKWLWATWYECWELNSGPLQEQQAFLSTDKALQAALLPSALPRVFKMLISFWMMDVHVCVHPCELFTLPQKHICKPQGYSVPTSYCLPVPGMQKLLKKPLLNEGVKDRPCVVTAPPTDDAGGRNPGCSSSQRWTVREKDPGCRKRGWAL